MRLNFIATAVSLILKYMSLVMLIPLFVAFYFNDQQSVYAFAVTAIIILAVGFVLNPKHINADELNDLKKNEALAIVFGSWTVLSLISMIPYLFYGFTPVNALFEATSGITTTGATVLTDFSLYPKTMFFWRSFSQWLGGMGIIVLFIAVLPQFAVAGRQMFSAEAPGPTDNKFTPRIKNTAAALWKMYLVFTVILTAALYFMGMPLFDSVCNSFSTISCGGFSPNPDSILGYDKPCFVWFITFFMFLSGTGYALLYKVIVKGGFKSLFKNDEFLTYTGIVIGFSLIIAFILFGTHTYSVGKAIEEGVFQVTSIITTSGFATVDYTKWPLSAKMFLFLLMFTGACAGSASGGLKIIRVVFVFKYIKRELFKILHPNAVTPIRVNDIPVSNEIIGQMVSFVAFYFLIFFITAFAVVITESDVVTGFAGAIASLGNIGPAFGILGPMGSFESLRDVSKLIFIFNMIIGRLELIPFLAMLHPDFYTLKK